MSLPESLKVLLSDVVTFYFMAHGYHWNVEGPDFYQYHGLFSDIYGDAYGSIDPLAENLRKLGEYAPFDLSSYIDNRTVTFKSVKSEPKAMVKSLIDANDSVIKSLTKSFDAATKAKEEGIANFLAERIDQHQKWKWFLTSTSK